MDLKALALMLGVEKVVAVITVVRPSTAGLLPCVAVLALINPKELTPGLARSQTLVGRVRMLESRIRGQVERTELHLVVIGLYWAVKACFGIRVQYWDVRKGY